MERLQPRGQGTWAERAPCDPIFLSCLLDCEWKKPLGFPRPLAFAPPVTRGGITRGRLVSPTSGTPRARRCETRGRGRGRGSTSSELILILLVRFPIKKLRCNIVSAGVCVARGRVHRNHVSLYVLSRRSSGRNAVSFSCVFKRKSACNIISTRAICKRKSESRRRFRNACSSRKGSPLHR